MTNRTQIKNIGGNSLSCRLRKVSVQECCNRYKKDIEFLGRPSVYQLMKKGCVFKTWWMFKHLLCWNWHGGSYPRTLIRLAFCVKNTLLRMIHGVLNKDLCVGMVFLLLLILFVKTPVELLARERFLSSMRIGKALEVLKIW